MNDIKRIAINTGGGDAPELNAVIHAAVHSARNRGWKILGSRDGLDGLLDPENYPDGGLMNLRARSFATSGTSAA
jgi:6-phosphofructokinase 1